MSTNSNGQIVSTEVRFGKVINALKGICSTETYRRNLTGICFEKDRAIATNGHIACIVAAEDKGDFEGQVVIDRKDLPTIKSNHNLVLLAPESKDKATFNIMNGKPDNFQSFTVKPIDADFPDINRVEPKDQPVAYQIALDARYLRDLMEVHMASGMKYVRFTFFEWGDATPGPAVIESGNANGDKGAVRSLIMPVRI